MAFLLSYPSRDESELFFKITWVCIYVYELMDEEYRSFFGREPALM